MNLTPAGLIVLSLLLSCPLQGQFVTKQDLQKIVITDAWSNGRIIENIYELLPKDSAYQLTDVKGIFFKGISAKLVDSLIRAVNDTSIFWMDFNKLGYTSQYLDTHALCIAEKFSGFKKLSKKKQTLFISLIKDSTKVIHEIEKIHNSYSTDDYPAVIVDFVLGSDTFTISTDNQWTGMLPWLGNDWMSFNPLVSELISDILPETNKGNKFRLYFKNIEYGIANRIFRKYVE